MPHLHATLSAAACDSLCTSKIDPESIPPPHPPLFLVAAKAWMEVDQDRRGKIDYDQLCLILGLISQIQRGEEMSLETLDPDSVIAPKVEGYGH